MPDPSPVKLKYVRLPGGGASRKGSSFISVARITCRLWLGDDHLLQVESSGGYSESYKRFYFRDIQAIYLQKTRNWLGVNLTLGFLTGAFLLWMLTVTNQPGAITLGIIGGVLGFFLVSNLLRGPTCACHLQTAVHLEELPSLRRRRNANKVLARLKPLIETAQGGLPPEMVAPQYDALLNRIHATPAEPGQITRWADASVQPYRSRVHQILFIALLTEAVMDLLQIFLPGLPVVLLNATAGIVTCFAVITALVKQHQTDLKPAVRMLTWVIAAYVGLCYLAVYVIMMVVNTQHHLDGTQWGYLKGMAALKPLQMTWLLGVLVVSATISGCLGTIGLFLLRDHRREKQMAS